jgi:hypothetical protein
MGDAGKAADFRLLTMAALLSRRKMPEESNHKM